MISKKLANTILGPEYDSFEAYTTEQIMDDSFPMSMNDFANKCKEWAFDKGWILESCRASNHTGPDGEFESKRFLTKCSSLENKRGKSFEVITSEADSIIKAAQWILDNKNI